jgi:tetratricopeptide (TPR) repeat protein
VVAVSLRELLLSLGRTSEAKAQAEEQYSLLEDTVAAAATPRAALPYSYHRVEVSLYLGRGEELVSSLRALAIATPEEQDPGYRLAGLLSELGRHNEALAAAAQALDAAKGPSAVRVLARMGDILVAAGRDAEAVERYDQALATDQALAPHLRRKPLAVELAEKVAATRARLEQKGSKRR